MTTTDTPIKFAVFILTHGRPNEVVTYQTVRTAGYTGDIFLIIDNEDPTAMQYYERYGHDKVIMFDKKAIGETFDIADTRDDRRATVYARNASFDIARNLGLTHFMQLDDDYLDFEYRYNINNERLGVITVKSLDDVFTAMITLLDDTKALSVAMAQGGDFIGGVGNQSVRTPLLRKCMNSWLFRTDRPVKFIGRMNDDVNTYIMNGMRGGLFFTTTAVMLVAKPTQKSKGGMSEQYLDTGTYMKSFYTVMMCPSSVQVKFLHSKHKRLHHAVKWRNTVPKILNERHRKKR
jgi:hypothetical protein